MKPPAALITPPPVVPLHRRDGYTPEPDLLSSAYTWKGRPHNEWDLSYFPLWNSTDIYNCANVCLYGNHDSVDNYLYCQNNKGCVCQPSKLSTGVIYVSKYVETRCNGVGVAYVQTLLTEFCANAWREKGQTNVEFVIPRTGELVSTLEIIPPDSAPTSAISNPTPDSPTSSPTNPPLSSTSSPTHRISLLAAVIPVAILLIVAIAFAIVYRRRYRHATKPPPPQEVAGDIPLPRSPGSKPKGPQVWTPPLPPVEIGRRVTPPPQEVIGDIPLPLQAIRTTGPDTSTSFIEDRWENNIGDPNSFSSSFSSHPGAGFEERRGSFKREEV